VTLPLIEKIFKKISVMLPLMATTKKKIVAIRRKFDFWERREKRLSS
jgi:hypothetical protein